MNFIFLSINFDDCCTVCVVIDLLLYPHVCVYPPTLSTDTVTTAGYNALLMRGRLDSCDLKDLDSWGNSSNLNWETASVYTTRWISFVFMQIFVTIYSIGEWLAPINLYWARCELSKPRKQWRIQDFFKEETNGNFPARAEHHS